MQSKFSMFLIYIFRYFFISYVLFHSFVNSDYLRIPSKMRMHDLKYNHAAL